MTPRSLFDLMQAPSVLSREAAKAITDRALSYSTADECRIVLRSGWSGNTRFAGGEITTAGGSTDTSVSIISTVGKRQASVSTNLLDDDGLRRAVEQSERLARLSPEDPELMPELGPQQYTSVDAYAPATAQLGPEARAQAVEGIFAAARSEAGGSTGINPQDLFVGGFLEADAGVGLAVATSRGLFAYNPTTNVDLSTTVRTPDGTGSGYASIASRDWSQVNAADIGRTAARKAIASRNPQAVEPGRYTVILEPRAAADFVPLLRGSLNARSADEGRSAFSDGPNKSKIGQKVMDERVTLLSDPFDPMTASTPYDGDGLPLKRVVWIEDGVLRNLNYNRFWARERGVEPSGASNALIMRGGSKSLDQLIQETERGILVTRFWYIRFLDQRTVMVTGLTRDGTFLIENGRVSRPIKNLRWNESPLLALNRLEDIGQAEQVSSSMVMPALKIRDFQFTSLSDAV
ncbi:MAG TPA: TldD/PmbA family protein [Gemmatimonadales bacterium]|nr:TldD/PmbA family protein [Gemmatimonadales bacterium]